MAGAFRVRNEEENESKVSMARLALMMSGRLGGAYNNNSDNNPAADRYRVSVSDGVLLEKQRK